ncbi:MAG: class I mannose-6-phosphate isomerase [Clostridiales bacterium]|nr:class I mannose-6-phosphate isomerase [Clostridiales bacterium]
MKLKPIVKDYIWGGDRLPREFGIGKGRVAEAWMCSFIKGDESSVGGLPVSKAFPRENWGSACRAFKEFPVLIKLIDAHDNLSVQVHPTNEYAACHGLSCGKTEMWYVVDAAKDAYIYLGFKRAVTEKECREAIATGKLTELLRKVPVKKGESYFVPAGTVHAIGKGCLMAEVQQSDDCTFRVFDYNRQGDDGKPRELHIEQALAVLNFSEYASPVFTGCLAACPAFTVQAVEEDEDENPFSYTSLLIVDGEGTLNGERVKKGESFLLAAGEPYELKGNLRAIKTTTMGR